MPPKKAKVVDPEVLQRQWEDYQKTTESELWNDLYGLRGKFDGNTSETTQHLTGEWQSYHDLLFKLCTECKVKAKKPFLHEFIRSAFYGQDQLKDQDQKIFFTVYGKKIIFSNQSANACRAVRKAFIEIWRLIESAVEINEQTFTKSRKDMVALLKKFNTAYNEHIKSSHEEVSAILEFEMLPLESILISNIKWKVFYEMCEYNEDKVYVSSFKEKALAEKFCQDFDNWLRHMYEFCALRPGFTTPEILAKRILEKLKYENWRKNTIECFYLKPLWEAFYKLSSNLGQLFSMGKDYWKLPMQANEGIRADLTEVIDMEIKAEVLLGTELKRDQMKFLYDVIAIIYASPAAKLLFDKEKKPLSENVIPRLTIYKTLQHMIKVEEKRLKDEATKSKEEAKADDTMAKTMADTKELNVPMMATTRSSKLGATMTKGIGIEEKTPDQIEDEEALKYGRLYLWKDYMSPPCRELLLKLTKDVERINALVQFDVEDYIISEGTKPQQTQTGPNKQVANMLLPKKPGQPVAQPDKDDKKANTIIVKVIDRRPPFLWNDPNTEEQEVTEHKYRENAKPQDCYIDHRVEKLLQKINELADDLKKTTPDRWDMIVNRTIDVFEEAEKEKNK